jgi:LDH2 family malate/lactate/ureidoglycolate dehydrogenase
LHARDIAGILRAPAPSNDPPRPNQVVVTIGYDKDVDSNRTVDRKLKGSSMSSSTLLMPESLRTACLTLLQAVDVPEDQAGVVADVLVRADLRGTASHGVLRLPAYIHKIQAGLLKPQTPWTCLRETPATALFDAGMGLGPVAGLWGMKEAVRRADQFGISAVGVRNASHFGIAAYYALQAVDAGMIGVAISNAAASMAPWGGIQAHLGTNPVCVAIPTQDEIPLVLDMAATEVARGKIRLAQREGQRIPQGWALDSEGQSTTDPRAAIEGTLLPIGGPKGYGIALVNDILAGMLTGSPSGLEVCSIHDLEHPSPVGFFFQVLRIEAFSSPNDFFERLGDQLTAIRKSPRARGVNRIFIPGEIEWECERDRGQNGIPIGSATLMALNELAEELGVQIQL